MSPRSKGMKWSDPGRDCSTCSIVAASWSLILRATATARCPSAVSLRTMPRPSPRLPPVTMTLCMMASEFPCRGNLERGDEADRRRNLVGREARVTDLQDLALEVLDLTARAARSGVSLQHHIGGAERARNGPSPHPNVGHADRRIAVDRRLHRPRV